MNSAEPPPGTPTRVPLWFACLFLAVGCEQPVTYIPVYTTQPVSYVQPAAAAATRIPTAPRVIVPGAEVVAPTPPPPPLGETAPAAPGPNCVWVPGYWTWTGKWSWVPGNWYARPNPTAMWVNGRWKQHGDTYKWVPGHWN